jgi:hypothetical protein
VCAAAKMSVLDRTDVERQTVQDDDIQWSEQRGSISCALWEAQRSA